MQSILDYEETKPLPVDVQDQLLIKIKTLDSDSEEFKKIMDTLVTHNLRLIAKYANGLYDKKYMELDDVIALGIDGLMKAILKYDPSFNVCFGIYSREWIQTYIRRSVFKEAYSSNLSVRDYELLMKYYSCETRLLNERNGIFSREDVFEAMGLSNKQIDTLLELLNITSITSLNRYYNSDDKLEFLDIIASDSSSNYIDYVKDELRNDLQCNVLLDKAVYNRTYKDIATEYNMSLTETKNLYDDAIKKLKESDIAEAIRSC